MTTRSVPSPASCTARTRSPSSTPSSSDSVQLTRKTVDGLDGSDGGVAGCTYASACIGAAAMQERDQIGGGDFTDSDEVLYYHWTTLHSACALTDSGAAAIDRHRRCLFQGQRVGSGPQRR